MEKLYKERVELHCHSIYSVDDGVASIEEIIAYTEDNNMSAVAITDHENIDGFLKSDFFRKYKKFIPKIICGMEAYVVDDLEPIITNYNGQNLEDEFVAVDVETTGLSTKSSKIIQLSAVKVKNGKIIDLFNTYVNPEIVISSEIAELTGIDNEMVCNAPKIKEVYKQFYDFVGQSNLVAFNANFLMAFLKDIALKSGYKFEYTILDVWRLSTYLLPDLSKVSMKSVSNALGIYLEDRHTVKDEAIATAECFLKLLMILKERNIKLSMLNEIIKGNENYVKVMPSRHVSILVKDENGLKNLIKLIDDSSTKYFRKWCRIPLSQLLKCREGLLIGSACESGLLYKAIIAGYDEEKLLKIAEIFDYLEVQPVSHDIFMYESPYIAINSADDIKDVVKKIISIGKTLNIPVVATSDVHYLRTDDSYKRDDLRYKIGFNDEDISDLHFRTTKEMLKEFSFLSDEDAYEIVINNSNEIAKLCTIHQT